MMSNTASPWHYDGVAHHNDGVAHHMLQPETTVSDLALGPQGAVSDVAVVF